MAFEIRNAVAVVVIAVLSLTISLCSADCSYAPSAMEALFLGDAYSVTVVLPGVAIEKVAKGERGDVNSVVSESGADAPTQVAAPRSVFWRECWEHSACVLRPTQRAATTPSTQRARAQAFGAWLPRGMEGVESMMSSVSGSWLLEELSISKLDRCRRTPHAAGCLWGDGSTLATSYFDGPSGAQSLTSIRGSVTVQDDIVVGDTMKKNIAEEQLLSFVRERRGIQRTRSFVGSAARILGEEWRAFADSTNQTLFVRDADSKSEGLFELGGEVQELFEDPRNYLPHSPRSKVTLAASHTTTHEEAKRAPQGLFSRSGGVEVGISLYYTPPNAQSTVPPHIDTMDVVALQVEGCKEWSLRVPHVDSFLPPKSVVLPLSRDHVHVALRGANIPTSATVTLCPGDVLYLPRGIIHNTTTRPATSNRGGGGQGDGSSLHISIGIETSPQFTMASFLLWAGGATDDAAPRAPAVGDSAAQRDQISRRLWSGVPTKDRVFVKCCAARALLFALRTRVLSLRRGFVVPKALVDTTAAIDKRNTDCVPKPKRDVTAYLRRALDATHSDVKEFLSSSAKPQVTRKRWLRLVQDTLGSAAALKHSIDAWWPAQMESAARYDMSVVIGLLSTTVLENVQQLLATIPTDSPPLAAPGRHCGGGADESSRLCGTEPQVAQIARELVLWLFETPAATEDLAKVWAEWVDEGMQKSHEDRLAFAEWTWINHYLTTHEAPH
jgi:hypothetical protein